MPFAITCTIDLAGIQTLKALRARHLAYIQAHRDEILFGGPARALDGLPQTMIIILKTEDAAAAAAFIRAEPYTASGVAFSEVLVRPWSQVVPEPYPGALAEAIDAESSLADSAKP